ELDLQLAVSGSLGRCLLGRGCGWCLSRLRLGRVRTAGLFAVLAVSGTAGPPRPAGTRGAGRLGGRVLAPSWLPSHRVDPPVIADDRPIAGVLGCCHRAA